MCREYRRHTCEQKHRHGRKNQLLAEHFLISTGVVPSQHTLEQLEPTHLGIETHSLVPQKERDHRVCVSRVVQATLLSWI